MKMLAIATLVALAACQPGVEITEDEYGEEWPLTVEAARLWCQPPQLVLLEADGQTYAVNGAAQSHLNYPAIDPVWRDDPDMPAGVDARVSIAPLIRRGLGMCDE